MAHAIFDARVYNRGVKTLIRFLCALTILLSSTLQPYFLIAAPVEMEGEAPRPIGELGTVPNYSNSLESPSPLLEEAALQNTMKELGTVPNSPRSLSPAMEKGRGEGEQRPLTPHPNLLPQREKEPQEKGTVPFFNFGFNKNDQKPEPRVWTEKIEPLMNAAKPWESENLGAVEDIGIQDPAVLAVNQEFSKLYEKLRSSPPRGTLGGRKDAFSQRDAFKTWIPAFHYFYQGFSAVQNPKIGPKISALAAYYKALDLSYGASIESDPMNPSESRDLSAYHRTALSSLESLSQALGISVPAGQTDPEAFVDQVFKRQAGISLEEALREAEKAFPPLKPSKGISLSLGDSGALTRSLEEAQKGFMTDIPLKGGKEPIRASYKLLDFLKTAVRLNLVPLLIGPTGTGKSASVKWLAANNGAAHLTVAMKPTIGREEMMGSIRPTPKGLAWAWGFLIKAAVKGDWVTLEEFNLAPSETLEALNEFLNSGFIRLTQYLDEETLAQVLPQEAFQELKARGFLLNPHPHFRLFLTMNPDFYAGRNKLAQTLLNRTVRIWAPDYTPTETELILQSRYGISPDLALSLVENVYEGLKKEVATAHLGSKYKDKYEFNLRTLLRVLSLYKANQALYQTSHGGKAADKKTDLVLLGRAWWEATGFMMRTENDRQQLWLLLDTGLGLNKEGITLNDIQPRVKAVRYDAQNREIVFDDALLPLRIPVRDASSFVPPESFDLPPTPKTLSALYWIARRMTQGDNILLVGETASGKTTLVQYLHRILNRSLYYTNLSAESADEEIAGGFAPDPANPGKFRFAPGLLEKAGNDSNGKGSTLFVDEFNLNSLVEYFNTAQDDRILVTPEGARPIGPETVFIGAMNPPNYQSRNMLSPATRGRYWEAWIDEPDQDEMALRMGWLLKKKLENRP